MTDPTEALARVLSDVYYADVLSGIDHEAAQRILADPAPLLAALAEAGVLREQRKEWQDDIGDDNDVRLTASVRRQVRPGVYEYVDPRPVRYVTEWRPSDAT